MDKRIVKKNQVGFNFFHLCTFKNNEEKNMK